MLTAQQYDGHILGAFTAGGELAGFVYSFIGLGPERRLKNCSIIAAVDENYRGQARLPTQAGAAPREPGPGIELSTRTFDPLLRATSSGPIHHYGSSGDHQGKRRTHRSLKTARTSCSVEG
jgi:predicted GNAT superfamily acetyltransferase